MNDHDLKKRLQGLEIPRPSESARERALHRALIALEQKAPLEKPAAGFAIWHRIWWPSLAGIAIVICLFILHWPSQPSDTAANDRIILRQVEQLFPDQVNAVVQSNGKTELSIAQAPLVGSSQPVVVTFKKGNDTIRVLSYSGHRVCLQLGSHESCFDILVTSQGEVILEGDDQVWTASDNTQIAGYALRANTMENAL